MKRKILARQVAAVVLAATLLLGETVTGYTVHAGTDMLLSKEPEEGGGEDDFDPELTEDQILDMKCNLKLDEVSTASLTAFGDAQAEESFGLQFEKSEVDEQIEGRPGRWASQGGWFSYTMPVETGKKNYLFTTYHGSNAEEYFDIAINGAEVFSSITSDMEQTVFTDGFYTIRREIPDKYLTDGTITVTFTPKEGAVNPLYGISVGGNYDTDPKLQNLLFEQGTLTPGFQAELTEYTLRVSKDTDDIIMNAVPNRDSCLVKLYDAEKDKYILFDDRKSRTISLTGEKTELKLTSSAQDHVTQTTYTIHVIKTGDKSKLENLLRTAESKAEKDYTKDTWSVFADAVKTAKNVQVNLNATQTEIDAQITRLQKAMDGLKKIPPVISGKWITDATGSWYRNPDGSYSKNAWQFIEGKWYYFDKRGYVVKGWLHQGKTWYYCDSSGVMLTGWQKIGGSWYYFNGSGYMLTGWQKLGNTWYYLSGSGAMLTGWQKLGGTWYYFDGSGAMLTGWQRLGNTWYYFNGSGAMLTGWQKLGGSWYYLNGSGVMLTGWASIGGKWYYFNSSGVMQTGWLYLGGKWYYLYGSGQMAVNTWIGSCYVNGSGVWIK